MNLLNLIRIALDSLGRNKFRAFLTMLGIIIGVASVIVMLAIGQGSKKSIEDQISSMGTNMLIIRPGSSFRGGVSQGAGSSQSLSYSDVEKLRTECELLSAVSPMVQTKGQMISGSGNWSSPLYGISSEYLEIRNWAVESGRIFTEQEYKSSAKVCLIGKTVQKELFGENSDPIGAIIRFNRIPLMVIGVLAEKGESSFGSDQDDLVIAPFPTVQKRFLSITHLNSIYCSTNDAEETEDAIKEVDAVLRQSHQLMASEESDFSIRSQQEIMKMMSSTSDIMTVLLAAIAGISLLVGGIGIMNIMYVSVSERTREIGLRTAVGGRTRDIMRQFLIESVLLSLFGGMIGVGLGIISSRLISKIMGWPVIVMVHSVLLAFMFCALIGVFFGWYPARKAANLDPIDALRYE